MRTPPAAAHRQAFAFQAPERRAKISRWRLRFDTTKLVFRLHLTTKYKWPATNRSDTACWMPAFAGMTAVLLDGGLPTRRSRRIDPADVPVAAAVDHVDAAA